MSKLEKPFYLRWRAESKIGSHIYLRKLHHNALIELQEQLKMTLSVTIGKYNPSLTPGNAIEMLIEETLGEKNQLLRDYLRANGKMLPLIQGDITDPNIIDLKKYRG